jgi:hypothetical protein
VIGKSSTFDAERKPWHHKREKGILVSKQIDKQIQLNHRSLNEESISRGNRFLLKIFHNQSKKSGFTVDSMELASRSEASLKRELGVYSSGEWKYKLGVIDFLTQYTKAKKLETKWNSVLHYKEAQKTSC